MAHICNSISKYRMSCRNWLLAARQNLCSPVPFSTLFNTLFIKIPLNTIINLINLILTQFTSLQHYWGRWHCSQLPSGCSRSRPPRSCSTSHWFTLLWLSRRWWKLTMTKMVKPGRPDHVEQIFDRSLTTTITQLASQFANLANRTVICCFCLFICSFDLSK